jgi:hypothetical protein
MAIPVGSGLLLIEEPSNDWTIFQKAAFGEALELPERFDCSISI